MAFKKTFIACIFFSQLLCLDNPHFYRATFFWDEPRFEKSWLSTLNVSLSGGKTSSSRNKFGTTSSLLNIFGPHNLKALGVGVANNDNATLIDLEQYVNQNPFGTVKFDGTFKIVELPLSFYQNFQNGFFMHAYMPIRSLKISDITFQDLSPLQGPMPNINTPAWQNLIKNLPTILQSFGLSLQPVDKLGAGDLTFLLGWTHNNDECDLVDFFDVDARIGVLCPTGATKNEHHPFDLPLGYNGHYAIPLQFKSAVGMLEWLNIGIHFGALFFFDRTYTLRMKTASEQNGFIKLAAGKASVDQGTIWDFSTYLKADHVMYGLSCIVGYTFTKKDRYCITPENKTVFNAKIVNSDEQFQAWRMHALQFLAEYDCTQRDMLFGPRIQLFYNHIFAGERIFLTDMIGAMAGLDVIWEF